MGILVGYHGSDMFRILAPDGSIHLATTVVYNEISEPEPVGDAVPDLLSDSDDDDDIRGAAPVGGEAAPEDVTSPADPTSDRYPKRSRKAPTEWWRGNSSACAVRGDPDDEPATVKQALASPAAEFWRQAMDAEIASLRATGTYVLEQLPPGVKSIPVKWVFKVKRDANSTSSAARPVWWSRASCQLRASTSTRYLPLRVLLALTAERDLELHHLDVKTAFLNDELEETIYMQQPLPAV